MTQDPASTDYAARASARAQQALGNSIAHKADLSDGWGDEPGQYGAAPFNWLHVPHVRPLPVVILSDVPVKYRGHWFQSAMQACTGDGHCPLCERGIGGQIRVILAVYDLRLRALGLIELSAATAAEIRSISEAHGHLRGLVVELSKEAGRPRGRVLVGEPDRTVPPSPDPLPPVPDIRAALKATWARAESRKAEQ